MSGPKISKDTNSKNLIKSCKILNTITDEYTVFYGSMLGIHREGDVIDGDDDCDFLVPSKLYEEVKKIFVSNGYKVTSNDLKDTFTQFTTKIDSKDVLIDVYYYFDYNEEYVLDKWNFAGQYFNKNKWLLIPKKEIFDLKKVKYKDIYINIPNNCEFMCKFLYGERYKENLIKFVDYNTTIVDNKPKIIYS